MALISFVWNGGLPMMRVYLQRGTIKSASSRCEGKTTLYDSQNHADRPDVHFKAVSVGCIEENLGSDVIGCSADGPVKQASKRQDCQSHCSQTCLR